MLQLPVTARAKDDGRDGQYEVQQCARMPIQDVKTRNAITCMQDAMATACTESEPLNSRQTY